MYWWQKFWKETFECTRAKIKDGEQVTISIWGDGQENQIISKCLLLTSLRQTSLIDLKQYEVKGILLWINGE